MMLIYVIHYNMHSVCFSVTKTKNIYFFKKQIRISVIISGFFFILFA